jgi:predicted amidophosphoribosyltransferase
MNQLIYNFKKEPVKKTNSQEWYWKEKAISDVAALLESSDLWHVLKNCLWVPMPSSKLKTDENYDDRLMDVLRLLQKKEPKLDIRELLSIKAGRSQAHVPGSKRPSLSEHQENLIFDSSKKSPVPKTIIIFDDVITTGASFKAVKLILQDEYPGISIAGIFVARSIKQDYSFLFENKE